VDQLVVLTVRGELDALTAPQLTAAVDEALADSPVGVLIDLSAVSFLAAAGLGVLLNTHAQMAPNATFGVIAGSAAASRPITVLGLDDVLALYPTAEDAVRELFDG
jgi:anti-sigma B factor antagonist